ncbi:MAG: Rap1a/Tai family immunity protein [Gammaproteobacteria bacterium]
MKSSRWAPLALMLLALQAHAAPDISGANLARDMLADPAKGANSMKRQWAMGYIEGVMSATTGQRWCPGKTVPLELNYDVAEALTAMKPEQLKGSAAPLVIAILAERYPCKPNGGIQ